MSKVDFHIHTKFSDDGEFSPGEIVRQCEAGGMEWIAVTDHNSVRGVSKAMEEAVSVPGKYCSSPHSAPSGNRPAVT